MERLKTRRLIAIVALSQLLAILLAKGAIAIHVQLDGHHESTVAQLVKTLGFRLRLCVEQQTLIGHSAQYERNAVTPGSAHHDDRFGVDYAVTGHVGFDDGAKREADALLFLFIDAHLAVGLDYVRALGVLKELPNITLRVLTRVARLYSQTIRPVALRRYGPR